MSPSEPGGIGLASSFEDGVDVGPAFGGERRLLAAEVVLEPLDHRPGGDLSAFDGVLAGQHRIRVRAENALRVERRRALAQVEVRRSR